MTDGEILDQLEQWLDKEVQEHLELDIYHGLSEKGEGCAEAFKESLDKLRELRSQQTKEND